MTNLTTKEWFQRAQKEKFAIGAYNVDNFEIFKAVVQAAAEVKSPLMVEFSKGEIDYLGIDNVVDLKKNFEEEYQVPIMLNLDHSEDLSKIKLAVDKGFEYVHFDGGKLTYEDYLPAVTDAAKYAHAAGRMIEGEIDHITGGSGIQKVELAEEQKKGDYTNPQKAKEFVDASGVDTFASFIGNSHGLYASAKRLDLNLLQDIKKELGDTFLSLHGSSGTDENDIKLAIQIGITKINLNTEVRAAHREALEKSLHDQPDQVNVAKITAPVIEAVKKLVTDKMNLFGSAGKLG